ncbi:MAG: lipoyl(octanoyl) transferase LipB [Deltaproteobacteria bacterium]|nr:lipoyl(octanoyl) transferase LipB [Deltaproteobacteria bacterium]
MALDIEWLGSVPYRAALKLQEQALEARRAGASDRLLLLEHPPVVTLGRSARAENLRVSPAELQQRGIDLVEVARGGDVTYHGPGQLVGYLIVDLSAGGRPDVVAHLRSIETALGEAVRALGVPARTREGTTGVFVDDPAASQPRKVASIGVGVRGWVSWHGFALNVDLDLTGFDVIVPCGLHDVEMTSLARELGETASPGLAERTRERVAQRFAARWG